MRLGRKEVRGNSELSVVAEANGGTFKKGEVINHRSDAAEFRSQADWKLSMEFFQP